MRESPTLLPVFLPEESLKTRMRATPETSSQVAAVISHQLIDLCSNDSSKTVAIMATLWNNDFVRDIVMKGKTLLFLTIPYAILIVADCLSVFIIIHHFTGDTLRSWRHEYPAFPLSEKQDSITVRLRPVVASVYFCSLIIALSKPLVSWSLWYQSGCSLHKCILLTVLSIIQIVLSSIGLALRNLIFSIPLDEDAAVALFPLWNSHWAVQRFCDPYPPPSSYFEVPHEFHDWVVAMVNTVIVRFNIPGLQNFSYYGMKFRSDLSDPPRACIRALYSQLLRETKFWSVVFIVSSVVEGLLQTAYIAVRVRSSSRHIPDHYEPVIFQQKGNSKKYASSDEGKRLLQMTLSAATAHARGTASIAQLYAEHEQHWFEQRLVCGSAMASVSTLNGLENNY
ncbi:hypothetical protein CHU98_g10221 [Xylaria longipes]|nr:hypothetical protein CHU98_g10221 [Xylaria longipes]